MVMSLWAGVNFLHTACMVMGFQICAQSSADNTPIFQLLLNSTCTTSRPFLTLLHFSCEQGTVQDFVRVQNHEDNQNKSGISCHIMLSLATKRKKRRFQDGLPSFAWERISLPLEGGESLPLYHCLCFILFLPSSTSSFLLSNFYLES